MARNTKSATASAPAPALAPAASASSAPSMADRIAAVDLSDTTVKSVKIRRLAAAGIPTADIARHLQIKYQHARNVLIQPAPKSEQPATEQELEVEVAAAAD